MRRTYSPTHLLTYSPPFLLVLAAGFFEDAFFAAGEAVAAVLLDFLEDIVNDLLRIVAGFGVVNAQLWLRADAFEQLAGGDESLKVPAPLVIEEAEHCAAQMGRARNCAGT